MTDIPWLHDIEFIAHTMADEDGYDFDALDSEKQRQYRLAATKSLSWWSA